MLRSESYSEYSADIPQHWGWPARKHVAVDFGILDNQYQDKKPISNLDIANG